jgi:DNA-binding MarR family transcriptional regulator
MTRTLAALEELGLITRTPHATDGRQHLVALTSDAKALLREDRRRRDAWLSRRLAELTQDERDLLRAAAPLLDRITRSV